MPWRAEPRADALERLLAVLAPVEALTAGASGVMRAYSVHQSGGALRHASPALRELFGPALDRSTAEISTLVDDADGPAFRHFLAGMPEEGEAALEVRLPKKTGWRESEKWLAIRRQKVRLKADEPVFLLVTYEDITAEKALAAELAVAHAEAARAEIAKNRFLAIVSHELRTPLNAILGFSELLDAPPGKAPEPARQAEYIGLIHRSASHLLGLLTDILDMSKIQNGNYQIFPQAFSLSKCLAESVAIMRGQAAVRRIALTGSGFAEMPDIVADERAVRQILMNLLSNAIKFSEPGATVRVRAKRSARQVHLTIEDAGIGISKEHLAELGKPFFQADTKTDRSYQGTGLGLSVVRGLVELHDGRFSVESERGHGTHVTVSLPIHHRAGRRPPAAEALDTVLFEPRETEQSENCVVGRKMMRLSA